MKRFPWTRYLVTIALFQCDIYSPAGAQEQSEAPLRYAERFSGVDWLVGEWRGLGVFERVDNNTTYLHRVYSYDMAGMFIQERTIVLLPPDSLTSDYGIHQNMSVCYLDTIENQHRSRTFVIESYVSTALWTMTDDGMVGESTEIENGPLGMRTRFTIQKESPDRFLETFEIAMPGEEYMTTERLLLMRVK